MAQAPNVTYSGPLTITQGGTYSGNYRSTSSDVPVITIQTTQPVIIENCTLVGPGDIIDGKNGGDNLIIRNNKAYGQTPTVDNRRHGRFVEVNSAKSLVIEHNYFEHTTGIDIYQWGGSGTTSQTYTIRYNQSKNLDGRYRNGGGTYCNFLGVNGALNVPGAEVAWNEIINEPNQSLVEDNINFYNSSGTSGSPLKLHDNYVQGAYPYPATGSSYTGSGITIDGDAQSASGATAFINGYNNQLVSTCAAMNIASGHDNHYYNNRMVTCGLLPDGSKMPAGYAAAGLWNAYQQSGSVFFNNDMTNNFIGFYYQGGNTPYVNRQDTSPGACPTCTSTTHIADRPLTLADEQAEWTFWTQKLSQNGITLGAGGTSGGGTTTPTAPSAPTVSLSVASTGTVGTALNMTATAASTNGTITTVEFFNGATKIGEDQTAPYSFSYTPTAAGTLSLTARATNNAGAATSTAVSSVTVTAPTTTTPTTPTGTTPTNATFVRAINVGGTATTIDGLSYEDGNSASNFQINGSPFSNQSVTLNPATDAARADMIRSSVYDPNISAAVSGVASGTYSVYLYMWEDNNPVTLNITLEGQTVQSNYSSGSAGHWDRLGPFTANVTDGTINIGTVSSNNNNLSGIEIWKQNTTTTTPTTPSAPTVSLSAPSTGTVGTALALTASAASTNGTITKVEFFNGVTKLGEDLTAPYTFSYTPTTAGTLSLTARATNNAAVATTSAAVSVTVTAPTTTTPTTTPPTFVRAVNLGGGAITLDGKSWAASASAPNFRATGVSTFSNQNVPLTPATDATRASMIRSSMYGSSTGIALSGVSSGTYSVYLYVWEDNGAETFNISLEGKTVLSGYNSGSAGHWDRLGPFTANVTDGTVNIATTGGMANLSGIELWKQATPLP
ncbi:hypothetical protein KB206_05460 [Microvirga sp. STS02]|uniref:Ig-like domain-containing protein n=1 Tax=Hymenobacter negativus TaxID=2795026 RepID=UPI0018DCDC50|nr:MULTISPECIES: Ig-like domain-containing protein [Bacteria]MBH8568319.1 hypothetical protein [Hymenobacter negativus]MBR7208054.1 hypothetical protein [Microvirga sp. STS02]